MDRAGEAGSRALVSAPLATIKLGLHLVSEANKHEHYRALPTAPATLDSWQTIHAARAALERATRAA